MAKQKLSSTEATGDVPVVDSIQNSPTPFNENTSGPTPGETHDPPAESTLSPYIKDILKIYPDYEGLYIDKDGGAFIQSTPEMIRKGAVYYENPFYNS